MYYKIEKEKILKFWIVWECHKNYRIDLHHSKLKKSAKKWMEENL